jgi:hypothetical protein
VAGNAGLQARPGLYVVYAVEMLHWAADGVYPVHCFHDRVLSVFQIPMLCAGVSGGPIRRGGLKAVCADPS